MKLLVLNFSIILLVGCFARNHDSTVTTLQEDLTDEVLSNSFIDSTKFPFYELDSFNLRDWYYGKRQELTSLANADLKKYFQDTISYQEGLNSKYFSIQRNAEKEKIITLIVEHQESGTALLHLLIYNANNKLLSNNIVASTGGDGGTDANCYGAFIDDTTYNMTCVGTQTVYNEVKGEELVVDSTIRVFRFNKNMQFEKTSEKIFPQRTLGR
jgi:hypothetical protein